MHQSILVENQILVTKFYVPMTSGSLIARPRLTGLLDMSLKSPFTLVSAAAGFGKTTLLATWSQSLPASNPRVGWVSLDEEDNDPRLFWTYVLTALNRQMSERFSSLLMQLQSPQAPIGANLILHEWQKELSYQAEEMGASLSKREQARLDCKRRFLGLPYKKRWRYGKQRSRRDFVQCP